MPYFHPGQKSPLIPNRILTREQRPPAYNQPPSAPSSSSICRAQLRQTLPQCCRSHRPRQHCAFDAPTQLASDIRRSSPLPLHLRRPHAARLRHPTRLSSGTAPPTPRRGSPPTSNVALLCHCASDESARLASDVRRGSPPPLRLRRPDMTLLHHCASDASTWLSSDTAPLTSLHGPPPTCHRHRHHQPLHIILHPARPIEVNPTSAPPLPSPNFLSCSF